MNTQTKSPQQVQQDIEKNGAVLIDVREPLEFAGERIPGAHSIPAEKLNAQRLGEFACEIILYCNTSRRSGEALARLAQEGLTTVTHLAGGLESWKSQGFATKRSANAPRLSLMRQVFLVAGSLVLLGILLGAFVATGWLFLSGFVGTGLMFSGATGWCGMGVLLSKMPWNRLPDEHS